ncbi:hypothetical protein B0H19DRAFT_1258623 [Mycena capillaripes]|nr:hypothetical protein B0H19DRAFT_1258623 [Mycena capillaripes]
MVGLILPILVPTPFADQTLYVEDTRELPFAVGYNTAGKLQRLDPSTGMVVVLQSVVALTSGIVREGPPVEIDWLSRRGFCLSNADFHFFGWFWHDGLLMRDLRLELSDFTVKVTVAIRAWQQFHDDAGHCLDILIMLEQLLFWLGQNRASVAWSETYGNLMVELVESVVPEGLSDTHAAALLRQRTSMRHFGFSSACHHPTAMLHILPYDFLDPQPEPGPDQDSDQRMGFVLDSVLAWLDDTSILLCFSPLLLLMLHWFALAIADSGLNFGMQQACKGSWGSVGAEPAQVILGADLEVYAAGIEEDCHSFYGAPLRVPPTPPNSPRPTSPIPPL